MTVLEHCSRFAQYREKVMELFASKGFFQVGIRELATYLGLALGSLYHHFRSKQHLLLELIEEFYEELLATVQRVEQTATAQRAPLKQPIHAHLTLHQEMLWRFRLAERDSGCLNEEQQQRVQQWRTQYECKLLLMLDLRSQLPEQGMLADGHAIAALLNSSPGWEDVSQEADSL